MSDYQHILLAVDYSEHGDYVAVKARSLANKYQAKLSIMTSDICFRLQEKINFTPAEKKK